MSNIDLKRCRREPLYFFENLTVPSAFGNKKFGAVMAEHQRCWFEAIAPALLAIAAGEKPEVGRYWSERTKGASKDSDIACVLLWLLAFCPNKLDMQVGASDRDQAGELKKAAADMLRLNGFLAARVEVQAWTIFCKATGSECTIVATDVAGSHGARPDIVVLNELSHVTKEEFAANLLDNATKKPHGLVIVATNAGFTGSWQEQWRDTARKSDRWHFHSFCEPAPWLSDAEIEEARQRNSTARFQRLFWGEWVAQSGDALDADDIADCVREDIYPGMLRAGDRYVAGLDLGVKHDHSALVVLAVNHRTLQFRLVLAQSWKPDNKTGKVDLMAVESAIVSAHQRYKFRKVGYDPFQAALMAQRAEARRCR